MSREDYYGYMEFPCGECLHFEREYSTSIDCKQNAIVKQLLDFGHCDKYGIRVRRDYSCDWGCYERD